MKALLHHFKDKITEVAFPPEIEAKLGDLPNNFNEFGYDDWGMHPKTLKGALGVVRFLYEDYFRVEVHGIENLPEGRLLMVANHGGQLPLDGLLLFYAAAMKANPPRVLRAMIERFVPRIPFVSTFMARCGQVIGDPKNCRNLLQNDEAVLVFPEGVRGSGKLFWKRYQLQRFGTGFMRLALETNSPIVPAAVVGTEETYPAIYNAKNVAKFLKLPYFPITPFWPALGPLGAIPLPTKIRLYIGEPLEFTGDFDGSEQEIQEKVDVVTSSIQKMIQEGLRQRGHRYF